jgi:predicted ArsR family transcriptional regulator
MSDFFESLMGEEKTQKDLVELLIKRSRISIDYASDRLKVDKRQIVIWFKELKSQGYADLDKKTGEIILGEKALQKTAKNKVEEQAPSKKSIIEELEKNLLAEKKKNAELQEQIAKINAECERKIKCQVDEVEKRLQRERAEREKLERIVEEVRKSQTK